MDIHAAIEEYLATKRNSITHDTYCWYCRFLDLFLQWCRENSLTTLPQLTPTHIQQFVAACPTDSPRTRHHRAQIVKGFLSWCAVDDETGVKEKTVKRICLPKVELSEVSTFTDEEIHRLLLACEKTQHPHRNRAIVYTLLDTGLRAAELAYDGDRPEEETGLRMENLILGRGDSFVRVMGKGRKPRTVGLGQETTLAVRRYLSRERGKSECPFVFLNMRCSDPLSVRMLQQLLAHLGELAHVENVHPHRFRHTFAVNQLMNGTSALVLMQLLGHTTLEATKIYSRSISHTQARKAASSVVDQMKRKSYRKTL